MSDSIEQSQVLTEKCPKCKEDIQPGAKKCKHCGADLRNWFVRHKIITGILVLILVSIFGGILSGGSDPKSRETSTANSSDSFEEKDKGITHSINEDVEIGNLKIRVFNVENLGNSISQSFGEPIKTQGNFIRVDFEVENLGKEGEYMGDMKIVDSSNREFSESDNKFSILGDDANFLDKLNPNVKTNYSSVFDVATDAKDLKLKVNGFGLFNTDYALITLGVNAN